VVSSRGIASAAVMPGDPASVGILDIDFYLSFLRSGNTITPADCLTLKTNVKNCEHLWCSSMNF
jgi:hypothetical protein